MASITSPIQNSILSSSDILLQCLLSINELYSPLSSRNYNRTYLVKLSALPEDCPERIDTIMNICKLSVKDILDSLDIQHIPSLHYKKLQRLINNVAVHLIVEGN